MNSKSRTLSKGKEKLYLDWNTYIARIYELVNQIKKSKIKFNYVYGIPRGGCIPATIISHSLNKRMIVGLQELYKVLPSRVLIVDDVVDSGKTFNYFVDNKYKTAALYSQINSKILPDFYVAVNTCWVVFPYEKD
jgi:hypoxanthine phosphoribosyltransferase